MRLFTLRQRRLVLRPVPAAGSTLPTCIFETILKSTFDSFGPVLLPLLGFLSPRKAPSSYETRCQTRSQHSLYVLKLPLPSRTSQSLGLVAPGLILYSEAYPNESPDLPSLPATPK